ncbi:MAG: hypothetical protein FGM37_05190 [Phycisphaerales bacterium]|nr:hypothetical protein [Phycisphaerales bacterium]
MARLHIALRAAACGIAIAHGAVPAAAHQQQPQAEPPPRPALMPPDADTNAAAVYLQSMRSLGIDPMGSSQGGALSQEEWLFIQNEVGDPGFPGRNNPQWRARAAEVLERARPGLDALRDAARLPQSDWGLDRSAGIGMRLPHLANQRQLARLMAARAEFAIEEGDAATAVESLEAMARMGRHSGQDRILISSLVSTALLAMTDGRIDQLVGSGMLTPEQATPLATLYAELAASDPSQCADAVRGEADLMMASVKSAMGESGDMKAFAEQMGASQDAQAQFEAIDEAAAQRQLEQYAGWMDRAAAAFESPDIDTARATMAAVMAEMKASPDNLFAAMMMPALDRSIEQHFTLKAMLADRAAQLKAIADGTADPASLANAAWFLMQAGRAAAAIGEIDQQAMELMRIDCGVAPADQALRARGLMERSERSILEMLERAAGARRCDFLAIGLAELEPPGLALMFGARTRAASRIVLADAADRACRGDAPEPIVRRLAAAFAASHALVRDPSVGRAVFARAIFTDALATLELALVRKAVTPEQFAPVRTVLQSFDRADPFGIMRGRDADAHHIGREAFVHRRRRIVPPELVERIAQAQRIERARPPAEILGAAWRTWGPQALDAPAFVPGAPLLLATDVHDPARVKAFLEGEQATCIDMEPIVAGAPMLLDRALAAAGDAEAIQRAGQREQGTNERRSPD